MRTRRAGLAALGLAAIVLPATASAERWVYTGHAGGGVGLQLVPAPVSRPAGTVFLESVLGLGDRVNLEAPALIELGANPALTIGTGAEYVYLETNHWRLSVGAGGSLRYRFGAADPLRFAPYLTGAVRWLFTWGVGASLGVHLLFPVGATPAEPGVSVRAYPSLCLYQEFW
ncbi:MAG: hypothetical protein ACYC8T_28305 [Myxococcaceae bacterium]